MHITDVRDEKGRNGGKKATNRYKHNYLFILNKLGHLLGGYK